MELYYSSNNNNVFENNVTASNWDGIVLFSSSNNHITRNNITENKRAGIYLYYFSNSNRIFHNNFIDNGEQAYVDSISYDNLFDDGYPSGGNYWSDYTGVDLDHDGISDTPYSINAYNQDNYPLMVPYVIPEFPSILALLLFLFMIATLLAVIIYKYKPLLYAANK